jgi:uncharacterized protein YecT (DUF1311 family)
MGTRRDYIAEIEAKRGRNRSRLVAGALRLHSLNEAFRRVGSDEELLRYFPIATIAIVEGFTRHSIRRLIDRKEGSLSTFLGSQWAKDQKFDLAVLHAIAGRRISTGELIAHLLPIKSVENINTVMSAALGEPFVALLGTIQDRWSIEIEGKPPSPIISDLDAVLRTLASTFRVRHVLAHEPLGIDMSVDEVREQLSSAAAFINAADEIVSRTINPNAPLTQMDMNIEAARSARLAEEELDGLLSQARRVIDANRIPLLDRSQDQWRQYRGTQIESEGMVFEGGSIRPMIEAGAREAVTRHRIADVRRLLVNWEDPTED